MLVESLELEDVEVFFSNEQKLGDDLVSEFLYHVRYQLNWVVLDSSSNHFLFVFVKVGEKLGLPLFSLPTRKQQEIKGGVDQRQRAELQHHVERRLLNEHAD